jgi:hypothetical protein
MPKNSAQQKEIIKIEKILEVCSQISDSYETINLLRIFKVYLENDEDLEYPYDENLCHAILTDKNNNELRQCSRYHLKSPKEHYCKTHLNKAVKGELTDGFIIKYEVFLSAIQSSSSKNINNETQAPTLFKGLRNISIDGIKYFVDQNDLTVYNIHKQYIGTYQYNEITNRNYILFG